MATRRASAPPRRCSQRRRSSTTKLLAAEPSVGARHRLAGSMLLPPRLDAEPVCLALDGPSLPTAAPRRRPRRPTVRQTDEPRHPMAHLMPEKVQPNDSSICAAQVRAAKKAKARRRSRSSRPSSSSRSQPSSARPSASGSSTPSTRAARPERGTRPPPAHRPPSTPAATSRARTPHATTAARRACRGCPGQAGDAVGQVNGDITAATTPARGAAVPAPSHPLSLPEHRSLVAGTAQRSAVDPHRELLHVDAGHLAQPAW